MRQTLGKINEGPLINPSKFGCDGKAVNTIHCFKAILKENEDCTDPECEGSHVYPTREVFKVILSLDAQVDSRNGRVKDLSRDFLYNVLGVYCRKNFRRNTLLVITRRWNGKQLDSYPRDLQHHFRVKCAVPDNMFQGTIIDDMFNEFEWLKQIEDQLPPRAGPWPPVSLVVNQSITSPTGPTFGASSQAYPYRLQRSMGSMNTVPLLMLGVSVYLLPP
ncbi:hypothetical protein J4E91_009896 [Alternaria rosae]|nr:hypothetical protein J4E91_009896 [Alternaria rosae]